MASSAVAAPPTWRSEVLLAALLFLFALAVRLALRAWTGFDGLTGLDPYAYYDYAQLLGEALARGEAPPPFFWPLGYPLLCVVAGWFLGPGPQAGQTVALLCGALCAPLQYALTRQVLPGAQAVAVLAGAMMATAYFAVSSSLLHMSDMPALCMGLCAANAMLAYTRGLRPGWLAIAAVALALALLTRWVYALLVAPLGVAALVAYAQCATRVRRVAAHAALAVVLGGGLLVLHTVAGLQHADTVEGGFAGDFAAYSWTPRHFFQTTFESGDGTLTWPVPPALYYLRVLWNPWYIAPVVLPVLLLGVVGLWRRAPRPAAALVAVWAVGMYVFHAGVYYQNSRFPLAYLPPLLVLVAAGVDVLGAWARTRLRGGILVGALGAVAWVWSAVPLGGWWLALGVVGVALLAYPRHATACLCVALAVLLAPQATKHARDLHYTHTVTFAREVALAQWIAAQVPAGELVLVQGNLETMRHRTACRVRDFYHLREADVATILREETALVVALRPEAFAQQWAGRSPVAHWDAIQAQSQVDVVAQREGWVVYRVVPRRDSTPS